MSIHIEKAYFPGAAVNEAMNLKPVPPLDPTWVHSHPYPFSGIGQESKGSICQRREKGSSKKKKRREKARIHPLSKLLPAYYFREVAYFVQSLSIDITAPNTIQ